MGSPRCDSDSDSSSDYCELRQKKVLDVELPDDFDPKSIPKTGEEYLQHVMYERLNKCKKLVTVTNPLPEKNLAEKKSKDLRKVNVMEMVQQMLKEKEKARSLDKFCPSKEWQEEAIQNFKQLRNFIKNTRKIEPTVNSIKTGCFYKTAKQSPVELSVIMQYTQKALMAMLMIVTDELDNFDYVIGISENLGGWIYGILAVIEDPTATEQSDLRMFARKCASIRAKFGEDTDESLALPLSLYICIVARFFRQLDLAD